MKPEVAAASAKLHTAEREFLEVVKKTFPVSSRVRVTIGNAVVMGTVESYEHDGSRVYIRNEQTGKRRHFYPTVDDAEVIE